MRFGEKARGICRPWLIAAAAVVFAAFITMLALGVIFPLGVQGADHPIDDNGQAVDFQPTMVMDVSVANTNQGPGEVSGFRFQFTTPDALTANEDAITVHFDKDFRDLPQVLSRGNVTVSASVGSGSATTDASGPGTTGAYIPHIDTTREILTSAKHGLSNSAALNNVEYTFYVPDMNGDIEGSPGIAAGATVSVLVSSAAGIRNPTEAGNKGPIGVFTSKQSMMDTSLRITVDRTIRLSDYDTNRGKLLTVVGRGFKNDTTATIYLDNADGNRQALVSVPVTSDDTFEATFTVTVPPFVPGKGNWLYAEDGNEPPQVSNRLDFKVEGLLTVSPTSAAVGDEIEISLVDWPDGPIPANAVTIAGVTQKIIGSPSVSGNSAIFRIEVGTATPSGTNEIRVIANGEIDVKKITIIEGTLPPPGDVPPDLDCVERDRAALVALYNATDGENWTNNTKWLTDAPLHQWRGVSTDASGRVTDRYLARNGLSGEIPNELGSLTNLRVLGLEGNQLSGQIPAELGSLTNLGYLDLNYNRLSGEIPAELGSLTGLGYLDLHQNQLSGEIPAWLGSMTNLKYLSLSGNQLSGEIPSELGNLTNLTRLYLGFNQLTGAIPAELGSLTSLATLRLDRNLLGGEIPEELGNLTNLTELHLSYNQLSGEMPEELGNLINLKSLQLEVNRLSGEIPGELGNLANLNELHLHVNQLSGELPGELGNLTNLNELDFSENPISGEIPKELGNLTNLKSLRFKGNQLSGEIPAELGSMSSLEALFLSHNRLSGPIPEELGNLTNLAGLFLNDNQLSGEIPAELGGLSNLQVLYLNNNRLRGEIPAEFGRLTSLTYVTLSANRLSGRIPGELGGLFNLTFLDLRSNQLRGEIPAGLNLLSNLRWLNLSHNRLSGEIPSSLGSLSSLERLRLRGNRLSGEIPAELGNLSNLQSLWLEGNRLSGEIPTGLGDLMTLESLYLAGNRLTGCVPASLRGVASHDLARLGLPFCDMLDGSPVVVIRFVSKAGAPVRLGSPVSLEAAFSGPVTGFALEDVNVSNGVAGNFAGSGAVYTLDVTPNAIGEAAVDIAAGVVEDADGNGNIAARLSLGIPYDDDGDGMIEKSEIIAVINDYLFDEIITREQVIAVITLYLFG